MRDDHAGRMRRAKAKALRSAEAMTEEEDAALTAAALNDPDNPPLDVRYWKKARPATEARPDLVARHRAGRGPQKAPTKQLVSLRIDRDVLEHFRATGPGWQGRINKALRQVAKLTANAKRKPKGKAEAA